MVQRVNDVTTRFGTEYNGSGLERLVTDLGRVADYIAKTHKQFSAVQKEIADSGRELGRISTPNPVLDINTDTAFDDLDRIKAKLLDLAKLAKEMGGIDDEGYKTVLRYLQEIEQKQIAYNAAVKQGEDSAWAMAKHELVPAGSAQVIDALTAAMGRLNQKQEEFHRIGQTAVPNDLASVSRRIKDMESYGRAIDETRMDLGSLSKTYEQWEARVQTYYQEVAKHQKLTFNKSQLNEQAETLANGLKQYAAILEQVANSDEFKRVYGGQVENTHLRETIAQLRQEADRLSEGTKAVATPSLLKNMTDLQSGLMRVGSQARAAADDLRKVTAIVVPPTQTTFDPITHNLAKIKETSEEIRREPVFDVAALQQGLAFFDSMGASISEIQTEYTRLKTAFGEQPFGKLMGDNGSKKFKAEWKDLAAEISRTYSEIVALQKNPARMALLPEGSDKLLERYRRELGPLVGLVKQLNTGDTGKAKWLDPVNVNAYAGALGAARSGIVLMQQSLTDAGVAGIKFTDILSKLATAETQQGRLHDTIQTLTSVKLGYQQAGQQAASFEERVAKLQQRLARMNQDELRTAFGGFPSYADAGIESPADYEAALTQSNKRYDQLRQEIAGVNAQAEQLLKNITAVDERAGKTEYADHGSLAALDEYRQNLIRIQQLKETVLAGQPIDSAFQELGQSGNALRAGSRQFTALAESSLKGYRKELESTTLAAGELSQELEHQRSIERGGEIADIVRSKDAIKEETVATDELTESRQRLRKADETQKPVKPDGSVYSQLIATQQALADSMATLAARMESLAPAMNQIAASYEQLGTNATAAAAAQNGLTTETADINAALAMAEQQASDTGEDYDRLATGAGNAATDQGKLRLSLEEINAELSRLDYEADDAAASFQMLDGDRAAAGVKHLSDGATQAATGMDRLATTVRNSSGPLAVFDKNTQNIYEHLRKAAKFKGLEERLREDARRISEEQASITGLAQEFNFLTTVQNNSAQGAELFERELQSVGAQALDLTGDLRDAHTAMVKFATDWRRIQDATGQGITTRLAEQLGLEQMPGLFGRAGTAIAGYLKNQDQLVVRQKMVSAGLLSIEKNTFQTMSAGQKLVTNMVEGVFHGIGYEVINSLQMAVYGVKEFVKESQTAWKDYEKGIAEIYTIMPEASDYMRQKLSDDVAAITQQFGYLQGEILPAAYQALSLGIKPAGLSQGLETAATAARASVSELQPTLETGQALVNAYGGELYSLEQVYDKLFFAIKGGAVTMRDLNTNMAPITAVAGDVGVALEDVVAAITVMSRQGDNMSTISNMLSNMFTQIQLSETALGAAFQEAAGTDFRNFLATGHSLADAMALIDQHAKETGKSIASMVGGESPFFRDQQSMLAVLELTGKHLDDLKTASEGARDSAGSMAEAYGEVEDSLFVLEERAAAAREATQRELGEGLELITRRWEEMKLKIFAGDTEDLRYQNAHKEFLALGDAAGYAAEEINRVFDAASWKSVDTLSPGEAAANLAQAIQEGLTYKNTHYDPMNPSAAYDLENTGLVAAVKRWAELNKAEQPQMYEGEQLLRRQRIAYTLLASGLQLTNEEITHYVNLTDQAIIANQQWIADSEKARNTGEQANKEAIERRTQLLALTQEIVAADAGALPAGANLTEEQQLWDEKKALRQNYHATTIQAEKEFRSEIGKIEDADTFEYEVEGVVKTIRLNNIDAAEIVHGDEGTNMAWGQAGLRLTTDFLLDADNVQVSEKGKDNFERTLGTAVNEAGGNLEVELAKQGLAIPLNVELTGESELYDRLRRLTLSAAQQGRGVFSNDLVQNMFLEGSVTSMEGVSSLYQNITGHFQDTIGFSNDLTDAYGKLREADGEWVAGHRDNAQRIAEIESQLAGDLTKEQRSELDKRLKELDAFGDEYDTISQQIDRDLTDSKRGELTAELEGLRAGQGGEIQVYTGDPEKVKEAQENIKALREEIQMYFKELAFNKMLEHEGGITAPVLQFGVALGLFDQATADYALSLANAATATETLVQTTGYASLTAGEQAAAVQALISGMATTAQEALGLVGKLRTEHTAVTKSFEEGRGTQIYWDMAAGEIPETSTANAVEVGLTINQGEYAQVQETLRTLGTTVVSPLVDLDPTRFDLAYSDIDTDLTTYERRHPTTEFDTVHQRAEQTIDRLLEKTEDKTITYTYNIVVNGEPPREPEGGRAMGGAIYPGTWLVGEMGPELIQMGGYGYVTPNNKLQEMLGNDGSGTVVNVSVDARGASRESAYRIGRAARDGVTKAMRRKGY